MAMPPIDDDFSFGCAIHQRPKAPKKISHSNFLRSLGNNHFLFIRLYCAALSLYVKDNFTSVKFPRFQNPILKNIQAVYYQNGWPLYDTLTNDYNRSSHMNALLNHASLAESQYFLNGLRKGLIRGSLSRGHAATVWLPPPAIWESDKLRESRLGCNKGSNEFSACWLMSRLSKQKSVI